MANDDWRDLEHLVANIQRGLAPDAKVEHNVKLPGRDSEVERQIDVLVTQQIGQYEMKIAIDCKDYKTPVDVKGIEEFVGMVQDIGAHKGVLVCPAGFTATAKKLAKKRQIELYRPVDTGDHKWRVKPKLPATFEYVTAAMSFSFSCSYPGPLVIKEHPATMLAHSEDGAELGTALRFATKRWNEGGYPVVPGDHENLEVFPTALVFVDNGYGGTAPVSITVSLRVELVRYFGQLDIDRISGFLDEQTGLTITNAFTVNAIDPTEIQNSWRKLDAEESPPIKPVLTLRGLEGWQSD
ncbi:restriction endonuclease [Paraburkholderia sediminicola]|uniref:restriction endonuclease n=1 Tax=Paraburkholderia sediminicola TaxID=458836 RepID=UPI0038BD829C